MTAPRTNAATKQAAQPDTTLYITRFRKLTDPQGEEDSYADWEELCADFETNYDVIATKAEGHGWSPAVFTDNQRAKKNVEHLYCLVLDYDTGKTDLQAAFDFWSWEAFKEFRKVPFTTACLVHTSFSHTPEKPKFRVVMPLSRPVDAKEFEAIWAYVADLAEKAGHELDQACKDPSRMWFFPAGKPSEKPTFLVHDEGALPLDVRRILKECGYKTKSRATSTGTTASPSVLSPAARTLEKGLDQLRQTPEGGRNKTLNRVAFIAGRYVGSGRLDEERVTRELTEAGLECGLDLGEVESTIHNAMERGKLAPIEEKPEVKLGVDLHEQIQEAMKALAEHPNLFQKDGKLVCIEQSPSTGCELLRIDDTRTREMMSECADWMTYDKNEETYKKKTPPKMLAEHIVKRGGWSCIKALRAVSAFPILDPSGHIQTKQGYDEHTKTFFSGSIDLNIPKAPTLEDAKSAVAILSDVVCDFPFVDDAHRSAWLAALLSPLSRFMHEGNIPLVVIQANDRRVGKSKLAAIISMIVTGKTPAIMTHVNNGEEERKRIGTILLAGYPVVLIDNVESQFGGQNMNAVITGRVYIDRTLGKQAILRAENNATWIVNGKNMTLAPDMAQRCLHVRLQCNEEKPELRSGFKYSDLEAMVLDRRAELLAAALTVLRAYVLAGKPDQNVPSWGSFEPWSKLVRGALVWCGLPDPALTREELEEEADTELTFEIGLIEGWEELQGTLGRVGGITAKEAIDHLDQNAGTCPTLRETLGTLPLPPGRHLPTPHKLGQLLSKHRRKKRHGKMLDRDGSAKDALRWYVKTAS
jgi:hypothetical protein